MKRRLLLLALPLTLTLTLTLAVAAALGTLVPHANRAVAAAAPGAEPRLKLAVTAGFEGRVSLDRWAPLAVDVTNQGAAVTGKLVARQSGGSTGQPAEYTIPLTMPEGGHKKVHLTIPAQPGAGGVDVAFVAGGSELATASTGLQVSGPDDLLVGVLSREPLALQAITQVKLAGRTGNVRTVRLSAETMPENITLMANFDVLAIARFETVRLSAAQITALAVWVRRGGLLVLVGGPDWKGTLSGLPADLVPVKVTGTRSVDDLPVLAALGARELPARGRPFPLTTGTLQDARALAVDGTDPVVAVGRPGQGTVLYFGMDLTLEPFAGWAGAPTLWETLLLEHLGGDFWTTGSGAVGNPTLMARTLSAQPMLVLPNLRRLGFWLLGYALLVGPLGYGLLAFLRRRALMWALVPALAVGALGLLYYQGFVVDERAVMSRSVSVTEVTPGMPTTASRTYVAVFAPSRKSLKVTLNPGDLAGPLAFAGGVQSEGEVTRVLMDDPPGVEVAGMTMWNLRGLIVDREVPGLAGLTTDLGIRSGRLVGTITNSTTRTIRDGILITPSGADRLPDLAPGTTTKVDTALNGWVRPWQPVFQDLYSVAGSIKDMRQLVYRRQVLEAALGPTRDALPAPILLLAWLDEPPAPLAALGREIAGHHLIYLAIRPQVDPRNYDLPAGLLLGKLVAAEGQQRGRSPRGYFVAEGALTFSLQVPDIDLSVLREVRLTVETGGDKETVKTKLLNWSTGKWDEVTASPIGTAEVTMWSQYIARDGSLLVRIEVPKEGQEIRAPTISLRGGSQ